MKVGLGYEPQSRDAHFTVPTFDFYFKVLIPEPNKDREILERDSRGRILSSRTLETYKNYDSVDV